MVIWKFGRFAPPYAHTITPDITQSWLTAARNPAIAAELESIYAACGAAITAQGPACWASGRCCNFTKTGHLLYVTGLEAAFAVTRLTSDHPALTRSTIAEAIAAGGCPFQIGNTCGVHTIKPLGCRVYFCDKSSQTWQHELTERLLDDVRSLHDRHALEYRYGEWRLMLASLTPT